MTSVSVNKLLNSKWTAVNTENKEKHFLVTKVEIEKLGKVNHCQMTAIMTKRRFLIDWHELQDKNHWLIGWV